MSYTKTVWQIEEGTSLNRFSKENETDDSVTLSRNPGTITQIGTTFSVTNMNNIEDGIEDVDTRVATIEGYDLNTRVTTNEGDIDDILNNAVTLSGTKTFSSDALINGLTVGRGGGDISDNTALGYQVLYSNTTGFLNTALGHQVLYSNTSGRYNTAVGHFAGFNLTTGSNNILLGYDAQASAVDADNETVIGNGDTESCTLRGETSIVDSLDTTIASFESDEITFEQPLLMSGNLRRTAHNVGHLEGSFNNVAVNKAKTNPIYTIGSAFNPLEDTLDNMYGIGYCDPSFATFTPTGAVGWGMYVASYGAARIFLSGGEDGVSVFTENVNIGKALSVSGTCSNTTGVWATISDEAVKENIKEVSSPIDKVNSIASCVRQYNYRKETGIEQNQRTQFIAQLLIENGFEGHVNESDPMNEAVGGLLGWEYGDKEIEATYNDDGKILTEARTERIVTTEGRQQYSVEQNLTPYLFPAFKELNIKLENALERIAELENV